MWKIIVRNDVRLKNMDIYSIESMKLLILVNPDKSIKLLYEDKCTITTITSCTICSLKFNREDPDNACINFEQVYNTHLCNLFTPNDENFLNEYRGSLILISKIRNKFKTYEIR